MRERSRKERNGPMRSRMMDTLTKVERSETATTLEAECKITLKRCMQNEGYLRIGRCYKTCGLTNN